MHAFCWRLMHRVPRKQLHSDFVRAVRHSGQSIITLTALAGFTVYTNVSPYLNRRTTCRSRHPPGRGDALRPTFSRMHSSLALLLRPQPRTIDAGQWCPNVRESWHGLRLETWT